MESHQELLNKGKDMSWILRILDGTILFSAIISVSGMTWKKKKNRNGHEFPLTPCSQGRSCSVIRRSGNPLFI